MTESEQGLGNREVTGQILPKVEEDSLIENTVKPAIAIRRELVDPRMGMVDPLPRPRYMGQPRR